MEKIYNNSFSYIGNNNKDSNSNSNSISNLNLSISSSSCCFNGFCESEKNLNYKNFSCDYANCKKIYKTKENLQLHYKNIHLKEKPYSCCYCDKNFSHRTGKFFNVKN